MALTPRLDLRQSQSLVMTPQLQQAIKMLQLNNLEIMAYVDEQLEQNPLLERADNDEPSPDEDEAAPAEAAAPAPEVTVAADKTSQETTAEALNSDYDNMWNSDSGTEAAPTPFLEPWRNAGGDTVSPLDFVPAAAISLRDHLLNQLNVDLDDPVDRVIGTHLIDLLDEAGYIDGDIALIAERLGCDVSRVEVTLDRLQGFDPVGVFARDLAECLTLQLRERDRLDPIMAALIGNLDMLADHDYARLRRLCGADEEDFAEMLDEIKALNPKPGLAFSSEIAQTLVPDVIVRHDANGGWIIELNNETLPRDQIERDGALDLAKPPEGEHRIVSLVERDRDVPKYGERFPGFPRKERERHDLSYFRFDRELGGKAGDDQARQYDGAQTAQRACDHGSISLPASSAPRNLQRPRDSRIKFRQAGEGKDGRNVLANTCTRQQGRVVALVSDELLG